MMKKTTILQNRQIMNCPWSRSFTGKKWHVKDKTLDNAILWPMVFTS